MWLFHFLNSAKVQESIIGLSERVRQSGVRPDDLDELQIPLPSIATQQAIVAEIEAEQALVNANRELITRFEKKIQATLERVWGEDAV
jgi:type I restriction enzyme M protein